MSLKKHLGLVTTMLSFASGVAFAHHHELGTVAALYETAEEFQHNVSYSSLSYTVKYAAFDFDLAVGHLNHCVPPEPVPPPTEVNHHHEIPAQCQEALSQVHEKLRVVEYYLNEISYYTQAYQSYQEVREALNAIEG